VTSSSVVLKIASPSVAYRCTSTRLYRLIFKSTNLIKLVNLFKLNSLIFCQVCESCQNLSLTRVGIRRRLSLWFCYGTNNKIALMNFVALPSLLLTFCK
jgi:hypothetical protein